MAVAVLSGAGLSSGLAAVTAVLAMAALLPPAFTGHSAGAGDHQLAVISLALHILAAALWVGGLAGLLAVRRHRRFADTATRYSRLALACFVTTAISRAANAAVRLGQWHTQALTVPLLAHARAGLVRPAQEPAVAERAASARPWLRAARLTTRRV